MIGRMALKPILNWLMFEDYHMMEVSFKRKFMKVGFNLIFLSAVVLISACSSKQVHKTPDFSLTGAAAKKEIEDFRLSRISPDRGNFESESDFTSFPTKQFKKTMKSVSPKSYEMLQDTRMGYNVQWSLFALWFASIFVKGSDGKMSPLYWYMGGVTIGSTFYNDYQSGKAVDRYNDDLEKKFAPTLSYSFNY